MNNLMKANKLTLLITAVVMTLAGQNSLADRAYFPDYIQSEAYPKVRSDFLEPSIINPADLSFPDFMLNGEVARGDDSRFEPGLTANLPNVRVRFFIKEIRNELVANGGNDDIESLKNVEFNTIGFEADIEIGEGLKAPVPNSGITWDNTLAYPHAGMKIYDALVFGACENLMSFDIEHKATLQIVDGADDIGSFEGNDTTTIDSLGYYNFNYVVRATDDDGLVSDFHFTGIVSVLCSGLNALSVF